jgi:hypothetical protein
VPQDGEVVGSVREHLELAGFEVEVTAVQYEFQRAEDHAGNRMMRVCRKWNGEE